MKARLASDRIANRFQDRVDFLKGVQQASAATEGTYLLRACPCREF